MEWPGSVADLVALQRQLAAADPPLFEPSGDRARLGGVFVCFGRGGGGPGAEGDRGWAAAVVLADGRLVDLATISGLAGAPYIPGRLALREGALLVEAVGQLQEPIDVLLVNGTGRDHPCRAGLAVQVGAHLDVPTVGVTNRPLVAGGEWPQSLEKGALAPLLLDGETVGFWLRTRPNSRPLAIHAGWRTDPDLALALVHQAGGRFRTPEPLRQARRLAREERARG